MQARTALITGGTRGIGRAVAFRLAERGYTVALAYRSDRSAAEETLAALTAAGHRAGIFQADISAPEEVTDLVAEATAAHGPPTVLVNNAYRGGRTPIKTHEVRPEDWAQDLATNLTGQFLVTRACLPAMQSAQFGRIVFIGSLAMRGEAGRVAYASAKAALTGMSSTIAREYATDGITSNVVNPGFIDAGGFARLEASIRARALKAVPARRAGQTDEVATLVAYLASEDAAYLTGQVIGVDGAAR